jgi:nicotinate-nucleotide pyrophosphorylase (carboxylating)
VRAPGTLAGLEIALAAFSLLDPTSTFAHELCDGDEVAARTTLATIACDARALLGAERTALNFLSHLCGVATETARYVAAVRGSHARICETRKTLPGLRALEKYAVRAGGGSNHRFRLDDAILIKDNHIAIAGGIAVAIAGARARAGHLVRIEIEVDTLSQLDEVLACGGADAILLDNFALDDVREAVRRTDRRATLEVSGGVSLSTVASIAATGVDVISVGALTHSVTALDIGLDITLA